MSPLGVVWRHELRRVSRDRALLWLVGLFAAVSLYAAWNGSTWARERDAALTTIARQAEKYREEVLSAAQRRDARRQLDAALRAATVWHHPALPLAPLAPLSIGQAEGYPYDAKFHILTPAHRIFDALGADLENPATRAARFDLAFVIVFLLPLFLLAGLYDLWTQERDLGTSGFLLSHPIRFQTILSAKVLARGVPLLLSFTFVLLLAVFGTIQATASPRDLLVLAAVIVLYGACWIAFAAAVNVFAQRSTEAAMACGAAWLVMVVLLPALLSAGVEFARPAPQRATYVNTLRLMELDYQKQRDAALTALRETGGNSSSRVIGTEFAQLRRMEKAYAQVTAQFEEQHAERRGLADTLRFFSPAVIAQDALDRLAGTDADRALAFQDQVQAFLNELRRFVVPRLSGSPKAGATGEETRVPQFTFREPSGAARQAPMAANAAMLLVFSLLPLLVIHLGLRRAVLSHVLKETTDA